MAWSECPGSAAKGLCHPLVKDLLALHSAEGVLMHAAHETLRFLLRLGLLPRAPHLLPLSNSVAIVVATTAAWFRNGRPGARRQRGRDGRRGGGFDALTLGSEDLDPLCTGLRPCYQPLLQLALAARRERVLPRHG